MGRKTKLKIRKHNKVGVPNTLIEFREKEYVIFVKNGKDHFLLVNRVRINPMTGAVEYELAHRPYDDPFYVTALPEQIRQSKYFKG